ncbi:MAG: preprotein translocase subunit SecA [Anaeromicrobium sp.]|jgi:preprotein translocase subunit SecA|uniref:preprotein translocase subunit SecA n=1 Tax=Anaeromicrobium sp. TaxID=1929132 RepID=UPI0025FBD722|nr:preprotein translocase subunit SecA [Anaeromicrobium sp.]MCT4592712.1 preprotein translocase subunit SecA [Anaeromicrobium sp.]
MGFFDKILGRFNDREVKKLYKTVDKIEALEPQIQKLSDEELRNKTSEFKERLNKGETLEDILPEAFAVVREGAVRSLGMRHYRVQLLGGIAIHQGRIAEMKTGEGKTLVATAPVYLNALTGKGVHVVTVNDYLAKRDMQWMSKVYGFLGLSVDCIVHGMDNEQRRDAYNADITYGTNNEFGFDYLRDNMVTYKSEMVQRELNFAIVDEVDSILVDEARTPLIISGAGEKSTKMYLDADRFVRTLKKELDYTVDEKEGTVVLTDDEEEGKSGVKKAEEHFRIDNLADPEHIQLSHHINQALKAHSTMEKDKDYVIKDGEVVIVDEFTGRLMFGRRFSEGLHQAIEAKEGMKVQRESKTLATVTLQNYFRMYNKLSGMTGTAKTEEEEFKHIYNMDVVVVPTNKPIAREDLSDIIYKSKMAKLNAVINTIEERHKIGQPVLVGTISISDSELISKLLKKRGIKHEVLNAKQHEREAEIVAQAGHFGSVTIATNMAGRGTDIKLGGNPEFMAKNEMEKKGYSDYLISMSTSFAPTEDKAIIEARETYNKLHDKYKEHTDKEYEKVFNAGGLYIIGTERHESRRIDNQLRGRSGRQGDPGASQFYISLEDDLMRLFGSDRIQGVVEKLGMEEDEPLEARILSKSIEGAQKRVEGRNFSIRKHVLQYDDVMNKQRDVIYKERKRVLEGHDLRDEIMNMLKALVESAVNSYTAGEQYPEQWNLKGLKENLRTIFLSKDSLEFNNVENLTIESLNNEIIEIGKKLYEEKENEVGPERMRELERMVMLRVVDTRWMDHIDAMDQLRQGIGLRAYGQEDPVRAYQNEGFDMFEEMIGSIQEETLKYLFNVTTETDTQRKQVAIISGTNSSNSNTTGTIRKGQRTGRNELCPCGSGKKYKRCCGSK